MTDDLDLQAELGNPTPWWKGVLNNWVLPIIGMLVLFQVIGWVRAPSLPPEAPGFSLKTPSGEVVTLQQFRGKTVVLNFWATWCAPCKLEAPSFESFANANPDVVVLGLASDDNPNLVKRSAQSLGIHYPVLMADQKTLAKYKITTYPTTVIVDKQGRVQGAHTGILLRPQLWLLTQF